MSFGTKIDSRRFIVLGLALMLLSCSRHEEEDQHLSLKKSPNSIEAKLSVADSLAMRRWYEALPFLQRPCLKNNKRALGILMSTQTITHSCADIHLMTGILMESIGLPEKARNYYKKEIALGKPIIARSQDRFDNFRYSIAYAYILLEDSIGYAAFEKEMSNTYRWKNRPFKRLTKSEIIAGYTGSFSDDTLHERYK